MNLILLRTIHLYLHLDGLTDIQSKMIVNYNWNIFVAKMYKLSLKIQKLSKKKNISYLYDGPDYLSEQYDLTNMTLFTSSSFQVSILLYSHHSDIEMKFNSFFVQRSNSKLSNIFSERQVGNHKYRNLFVNITLSLRYLGHNTGYCKYGGLSIYDYLNKTKKEVLLL